MRRDKRHLKMLGGRFGRRIRRMRRGRGRRRRRRGGEEGVDGSGDGGGDGGEGGVKGIVGSEEKEKKWREEAWIDFVEAIGDEFGEGDQEEGEADLGGLMDALGQMMG